MTAENDIVLIHLEDKPLTFARIEDISPDVKKDWYHVKLLLLQVPLQVATWILRDVYIDGAEFTMNGNRMRLERVVCPEDPAEEEREKDGPQDSEGATETTPEADKPAKVISLTDRKKS